MGKPRPLNFKPRPSIHTYTHTYYILDTYIHAYIHTYKPIYIGSGVGWRGRVAGGVLV